MTKFLYLITAFLCLMAINTNAQWVGSDVFMQGDYVEVGVGSGGWYGTGGNAPSGYHPRTPGPTLGFVSDPDKDGWGVGVPNYCGDYFVPGYPQEGWDIQVGSNWAHAWLGTGIVGAITGANVSYTATATDVQSVWEGSYMGLAIRQTTILKKNKVYFLIKVTLKNTTTADIDNIYYDRTLDPDNASTMYAPTVPGVVTSPGAVTVNTIEFKRPNPQSKSLVSAVSTLTVERDKAGGGKDTIDYPVYLGIGSKDCRANPYIVKSGGGLTPGVNDSPSRLNKGDESLGHLYDVGETNTADVATGLTFGIDKLKPGDSTSFFMAYVLSTADLDSAFADMAPVFSYDGVNYQSGDTVKVCREATAADERKNLDIIGGDEYTWTWEARTGLENLTGTDNSILLTNTPVTYIVRPSEAFGCLDSMTITIMPYINPKPPTAPSPIIYCRNEVATPLKATAMPGASLLFYNTATGGLGFPSATPSTLVPGTFYFYVSQMNGICESARTPIKVVINPIPKIDSVSFGEPTTCLGSEGWIRIKADSANVIYTITYDKEGFPIDTPLTQTSNSSGYLLISGLTKGSYTNIVITNQYGCKSSPFFGPIVLNGPVLPTPKSSNNGPICEGDTAKLSVIVEPGNSYKWTGPAGFTSTINNPKFEAYLVNKGLYKVIAMKDGCESKPDTTTLMVIAQPKDPKVQNQQLCEGTDLRLNVISEDNTNYTWTGPNDFAAVSPSLIISKITTSYSGKYILSSFNLTGCRRTDTITIQVDSRIRNSVPQDTSICKGDSLVLNLNSTASSVAWTPEQYVSNISSFNPTVKPDTTTTFNANTKSGNTCPDTTVSIKVTVLPTPFVKGYDTTVRMNIPYKLEPMYGADVIKWKWSPADSLSCSDCPNPIFNSINQMVYQIQGYNDVGCVGTGLVNINLFCDGSNVTMPNTFTPNGDGNNDIFYVRGTGFTVKSFTIFNRLGQQVFRSENFAPNDKKYGWDGTFNGQAIEDASGFVYMIEVICLNSKNKAEIVKGSVLLIK